MEFVNPHKHTMFGIVIGLPKDAVLNMAHTEDFLLQMTDIASATVVFHLPNLILKEHVHQ